MATQYNKLSQFQLNLLYSEVADKQATGKIAYLHEEKNLLSKWLINKKGIDEKTALELVETTPNPYDNPVRFCGEYYANYCLVDLLSEPISAILNNITICIIPTYRIDTFIVRYSDWSTAIVLDTYLLTHIHRCAALLDRIISYCNNSISYKTLTNDIKRVMLSCFYTAHNLGSLSDYATSALLSVPNIETPHLKIFIGVVSHFILFHELAHLYLGHLGDGRSNKYKHSKHFYELTPEQDQELMADYQALKWLQQLFHPYYILLSLDIFFSMINIVDYYRNITNNISSCNTHPPSGHRFIKLEKEIIDVSNQELIESYNYYYYYKNIIHEITVNACCMKAYQYYRKISDILVKNCYLKK